MHKITKIIKQIHASSDKKGVPHRLARYPPIGILERRIAQRKPNRNNRWPLIVDRLTFDV